MVTGFRIQVKDGPKSPFRDQRFGARLFATAADAWKHVRLYDEDGIVDTARFRVVDGEGRIHKFGGAGTTQVLSA